MVTISVAIAEKPSTGTRTGPIKETENVIAVMGADLTIAKLGSSISTAWTAGNFGCGQQVAGKKIACYLVRHDSARLISGLRLFPSTGTI